ncbi:MAG: outer membrane protein assembly factor BamD [Byssovorax sp.]
MKPNGSLVLALTALLLGVPGAAGCESLEIGGARHATLTYTDDARAAYAEALAAFNNHDWDTARPLLGEVRKLFAYSRYARLAELRLADIDFEQEHYSDAITEYREFTQNHKNDPDVEYARYRLTKAIFKDIDDTVLLPAAEERDQATTLEAYRELRSYLKDFPKTRYRADEDYMLEVVTQRLMRHELYVARHYLREDNFEATIARVDGAIKAYPSSKLVPEAMILKGETLLKMKKIDEAIEVFDAVAKQKDGPFVPVAKGFLDDLKQRRSPPKTAAAPEK